MRTTVAICLPPDRPSWTAGVCSGFAHYLDVDVTLVRIVWVILAFMPPGVGAVGYLLAWLIMPNSQDSAATVAEPSAVAR